MHEHEFTLILAGDLEDEATLHALFEAGCDDATFGGVDGVGRAHFVRRAPSIGDAVRSAIEAVESVPGIRFVRVELGDPVTTGRVRDLAGMLRQSDARPVSVREMDDAIAADAADDERMRSRR